MYGLTESMLSGTAMSYAKYYQYTMILQASLRLLAVHILRIMNNPQVAKLLLLLR